MAVLVARAFGRYEDTNHFRADHTGDGALIFDRSSGPFGDCRIRSSGFGGALNRVVLPSPKSDIRIGFWGQWPTASNENDLLVIGSSAGAEVTLRYAQASGTIIARRGGGGGPVLGSSTPNSSMNGAGWAWFEMRVVASNTVGYIEIRLNNSVVLELSNIDTLNTAATDYTYVQWWFNQDRLSLGSCYVIRDGADGVIGPVRMYNIVPDSDVGPNNGTQSTGGTHWGTVDETPMAASDYVSIPNSGGNEERFGLTNLPTGAGEILGLSVVADVLAETAGPATGRVNVVANSVEANGGATAVGVTSTTVSSWFPINPDTLDPWQESEVNALHVAYEVV